jgi:hypothetical protein
MSSRHTAAGTYYKPGGWNVYCQRCGRKLKNDQIVVEWDQIKVCAPCHEERHPQDFVKGVADHMAAPMPVPETPDKFALPSTITVTGLTTAALSSGPENVWDDANSLRVQLVSGALPTASELDVLNGANLVAVQNSSGAWEVLQYAVASLVAPSTYVLTHLLRARFGTELAMGASSGSPFVFIGQSSDVTALTMKAFMGVGELPISVVDIAAYEDNGDVVFEWVRRSRTPRLDLDDWSDAYWGAPLDAPDERYEVEILDSSGTAVRTLQSLGSQSAVYLRNLHLEDWGSLQGALTARIYQVDQTVGRGAPRQATLPISYGPASDTLRSGQGVALRVSNAGSALTG